MPEIKNIEEPMTRLQPVFTVLPLPILFFSGLLWITSCTLPATSQPNLTPEETVAKTPTSPPVLSTPTDLTGLPPEPTLDVSKYFRADPIPLFPPGQAITISFVGRARWAVGSVDGESDHIFRYVANNLFTDVTPPEPQPGPDEPIKNASVFFLEEEKAWVTYLTGPGSLQTHVIIWRMVKRFPHVSWAPTVIETRGGIAGVDLYFLDEDHGWALITFDEGGMSKQYIALYGTDDGGATWDFLFDPFDGSQIQSCHKTGIVFENPQEGWVTRACRGLYDQVFIDRSEDGGLTWEMVNLPAPDDDPGLFTSKGYCDLTNPIYFPPNEVVVTVDCITQFQPEAHVLYLYSTKDGGKNWTMVPLPEGELDFITRFIVYSISRDIYKTENGGHDWTRVRAVDWDGQFHFSSEDRADAVVRKDKEIAYVQTYDGLQTFFELDPEVHHTQYSRETAE